jgi:hypothetical protein
MRQYTGSHREAWGSSVLGSIDSNVIDSPVAVLDKGGTCRSVTRRNYCIGIIPTAAPTVLVMPGYRQYANKGFL